MTTDPFESYANSPGDFGTRSRNVTPTDGSPTTHVTIDPVAKTVVAGSTGTLIVLPANNADGDWVTFPDVPVGFLAPFRVRAIHGDTTCTVYTVE